MSERLAYRKIALHVVTLVCVAAMVTPIVWMVSISLHTPEYAFSFSLRRGVTVSSYAATFKQSSLFFLNSLIVASCSTAITMFLGVSAGYGLSRFRFTGKSLTTYLVLLLRMFPPVLLVIGFFQIGNLVGLFDTLVSLFILNSLFTLPFVIWMMVAYFNSIPVEIDEAGLVDGCTRVGVLFRLVLPVSVPSVVAVVVYSFLLSWNEFMFAVTFIQSNGKKLVTVALSEIMGEWWTNYPQLLAMAVMICVPIMILFVAVQRYLIAGLAASAVKG